MKSFSKPQGGDGMSAFYDWFTRFLEEKGIDLAEPVTGKDGVQLQIGDVCQAICDTSADEQRKIKDTLVKIDFANGDVYHYLRHLAQALDKPASL